MTTRTEGSAFGLLYGSGAESQATLRENYERFVRLLEDRRDHKKPVVVIIDAAETGMGKSTLGIQLSRRLDPEFGLGRFAFAGKDLGPVYTSLPRGRFNMVQVDEPRGLLSRGGRRDEELQYIISLLFTQRKNRIGTILIAAQKEMFDSLILNRLAPFWLFIRRPGVAEVRRSWRGPNLKKSQRYYPYDRARISEIGFRSLDGDPFFEKYLDLAIRRNWEFFAEGPRSGRRQPPPSPAASDPGLTGPDRLKPPAEPARAPLVSRCGKAWGSTYDLRRHEARCPECGVGQVTVTSAVTGTK